MRPLMHSSEPGGPFRFRDDSRPARFRRLCFGILLCSFGSGQFAAAEIQPKALLPAPQKIQYGKQTFPLRGFRIRLRSKWKTPGFFPGP